MSFVNWDIISSHITAPDAPFSKYVIWTSDDDLRLFHPLSLPSGCLHYKHLEALFTSRERAVRQGITLPQVGTGPLSYEVHRWYANQHTVLLWGRRGDADVGEGVAIARVSHPETEERVYFLVTYLVPLISPLSIVALEKACHAATGFHFPTAVLGMHG